jgi:hypothetical protein
VLGVLWLLHRGPFGRLCVPQEAQRLASVELSVSAALMGRAPRGAVDVGDDAVRCAIDGPRCTTIRCADDCGRVEGVPIRISIAIL